MHARVDGWSSLTALSLVVVLSAGACGDEAEPGSSANVSGAEDASMPGALDAATDSDAGRLVNPAAGCPLEGPTREELGDTLEPLPAAAGVRELVVTPSGLYFRNADGIQRLSDDGSATAVAASRFPDVLAAGEGGLAWQGAVDDMEGIWTVPLPLPAEGATPTLLVEGAGWVENMAVDATHAYFDGAANDGLQRVPLAGGAAEKLAQPFGVSDLALDGGFVYYAEALGEEVFRVPVDGGNEEMITPPGGFVHHLALDASAIYTTGNFTIVRFVRADPTSRRAILRHAPSDSSIDNSLRRMILDGDRVVFADRRDNVGWVSKDGSDCAYILAPLSPVGATYGTDIALDADYLYLIDLEERELFRIARSAVGL